MKLSKMKSVLRSGRGALQFAILYDLNTCSDIAEASIDYIVENYGERKVTKIEAFENKLIISVE